MTATTRSRSNPRIILEGADSSGKSTLAERLLADFPALVYWHTGGPPRTLVEFHDRLVKLENDPTPLLVDRYPYISELIYGSITEGREPMMNPAVLMTMAFTKPDNHMIIYCKPPAGTRPVFTVKSHKTAEHVEMVFQKYHHLLTIYDFVFFILSKCKPAPIIYDWTEKSYKEIKRCVGSILRSGSKMGPL